MRRSRFPTCTVRFVAPLWPDRRSGGQPPAQRGFWGRLADFGRQALNFVGDVFGGQPSAALGRSWSDDLPRSLNFGNPDTSWVEDVIVEEQRYAYNPKRFMQDYYASRITGLAAAAPERRPELLASASVPPPSLNPFVNLGRDYRARVNDGTTMMAEGWATLNRPYGGDAVANNLNTLKGLGQVGAGLVSYLTSPLTAAGDTVIGRPFETLSGGTLPRQFISDNVLMGGSMAAGPEYVLFRTAAMNGGRGVSIAAESVPLSGPRLLSTEGNVGTYRDLIQADTKGDNITPNHIPSANRMAREGVSKGDGIAINMEHPEPALVGGIARPSPTERRRTSI